MTSQRSEGQHDTAVREGAHAPGRWDLPPPRRGGSSLWLVRAASLPLVLGALGEVVAGHPLDATVELIAFGLVFGGAGVIRVGIRAEAGFAERIVARAPRLPRKIIGAALIGAGVALAAALAWPLGLVGGAAMGALATIAALAGYGADPMRSKGFGGAAGFQGERVAAAVDRAQTLLDETRDAASRSGDAAIEDRIARLAAAAQGVIRQVEQDPRDLARARKFLTVYLQGAHDATVKFADLWRRTRDDSARRDFLALIDDLEATFLARRDTLMEGDRRSLDIEIDVLRHRLRSDGITAPAPRE